MEPAETQSGTVSNYETSQSVFSHTQYVTYKFNY